MLNSKLFRNRLFILVVGMVIGWLVLAACAAGAAEAPAEEGAEAPTE
jgi:hypothetical protein